MTPMDWLPDAPWWSCTAPITSGTHCRSPGLTDQIAAQFEVATHPRYKPRDVSGTGRIDTMCNIFLADVTKALGCEVQHLEMSAGGPREQDANAAIRWLMSLGVRHGWASCLLDDVAGHVDAGHVVVATWLNPGGIGHVALVVPSLGAAGGPLISQAGSRCFEREPLAHGFGRLPVAFFFHP